MVSSASYKEYMTSASYKEYMTCGRINAVEIKIISLFAGLKIVVYFNRSASKYFHDDTGLI